MKPNTVTAAAETRPNRLLLALAAAWMIVSLAIGGAISADAGTESSSTTPVTSSITRP